MNNNFDIIKFIDGDFILDVNVSINDDTVWLTAEQIAVLFGRDRSVISRHINKLYKDGEIDKSTSVHFLQISHNLINPENRPPKYYNLDVILAVGYKVNSRRGILFRKWATKVLKEYLIDGYSINEKRCLQFSENLISLSNRVSILEKHDSENRDIIFGTNYELIEKGDYPNGIKKVFGVINLAKNNVRIVDKYIDENFIKLLEGNDNNINYIVITSNSKLKDIQINENIKIIHRNDIHSRYIFVDDKYTYIPTDSFNAIGKKNYDIVFLDDIDPIYILKKYSL